MGAIINMWQSSGRPAIEVIWTAFNKKHTFLLCFFFSFQTEIKAKVGQHHLALQTSKFKYPYISITRFEPGKDPEYNFYIKVFAYLGDE